MINLLPYERRILLKSLYKRRLLVVGFVSVTVALLPLVLVLGVLSYVKYTEANILNSQYQELIGSSGNGIAGDMVNQIRLANSAILMFQDNFNKTKLASIYIEKIVSLRPNDLRISRFNFTKKENKDVLVITGIAGVRDSIINFGNTLDIKKGGVCSNVSVPVTTYARRVEVPFTITCELSYEN